MNPQHTTTLSIDTVKHIARLSRLALSDNEVKLFHKELERVLQAFEVLAEVEIPDNLANTQSAFLLDDLNARHITTEQHSHLQSDQYENSLSTEDFLASTPEHEGVFVRVPTVLHQES